MAKLISWNIDSINAALTSTSDRALLSQAVLKKLGDYDADIIAIQETKLPAEGPSTIIIDDVEVGKLKNGESMEFKTTAGPHKFEARAVSALAGLENFDLQDGDTINVKMKLLIHWLFRNQMFSLECRNYLILKIQEFLLRQTER